MLKFFAVLLVFLFISEGCYAQIHRDRKCLSYWSVGAAACKNQGVFVQEPTPPPPPPVVVQPPKQPSPVVELKIEKKLTDKEKLNIKVEEEVDDFLENHGKPPREFARFMINPTLENALVWAQKYDDMLARTEETTVAWMKAQHILKEKQEGNLNTEIPTLENQRRVVPDYGLEWSNDDGSFIGTQEESEASLNESAEYLSADGRITAPAPKAVRKSMADPSQASTDPDQQLKDVFAMMQKMKQQDQNAIQSDKKAFIPNEGGDIKQLLPNAEGIEDGKLHVNYYFSAECPYCKEFEVGFQKIIGELGDDIVVTCVDMTPSSKDIINIYGKVDCDWRPLQVDEMESFRIKSTPSLLVRFPNARAPELLEGNVSAKNLRTYLKL